MVVAQGFSVSSDWHDYIGMAILLTLITFGILILVFRCQIAGLLSRVLGRQENEAKPVGKMIL
jgi:hypothetical protein